MRGSYLLVNRTGAAIDSVHVVINRDVDARSVSLDRATKPVVVDEETGYRILALEQALQPGDSLRLSFDVAFRPRGFRGTSGDPDRCRPQRQLFRSQAAAVRRLSADVRSVGRRGPEALRSRAPAADAVARRRRGEALRRDRAKRGWRSRRDDRRHGRRPDRGRLGCRCGDAGPKTAAATSTMRTTCRPLSAPLSSRRNTRWSRTGGAISDSRSSIIRTTGTRWTG